MPSNLTQTEHSIVVFPKDRTPDGNILPEVRKRIVSELMDCPTSDLTKPYQLAKRMGVNSKTAASLAREAMIRRSVDRPFGLLVERDWLWRSIEEAMEFPGESIEQKIFKARHILLLFKELNELQGMIPEEENDTDAPKVYRFAGTIGPNMMRIFEERAKKMYEDGGTEADFTKALYDSTKSPLPSSTEKELPVKSIAF